MPIRDTDVFAAYFLGDTEEEASKLLGEYDNTLRNLSYKFSSYTGVDDKDLYQEGLIGLARAVTSFDEERSSSFTIFAIYKIKDAMREFVNNQARDIKVPMYIKEAVRISGELAEALSKAISTEFMSLMDIWQASNNLPKQNNISKELMEDISRIQNNLIKLADRSHTSVAQLLERAEVLPTSVVDLVDYNITQTNHHFEEDAVVAEMLQKESVERIKDVVTEDEFNLLWARYVDGMTIRELAPILKITPASIVVKTNKIVEKLKRNRGKILKHEDQESTEATT